MNEFEVELAKVKGKRIRDHLRNVGYNELHDIYERTGKIHELIGVRLDKITKEWVFSYRRVIPITRLRIEVNNIDMSDQTTGDEVV